LTDWIAVVGVPLLMRAVDFLTGTYRDRAGESVALEVAEADAAQMQQDLEALSVDPIAYGNMESEITGILDRLEIHRVNLGHFESQAAMWGEALLPAILMNNIRSEREMIEQELARLIQVLDGLTPGGLPQGIKVLDVADG
jgi:hypothetical protein